MDVPPPAQPAERIDALRAFKDVGFGSTAGMVAKVFEHPFDLCKVRLQSQVLDETARFSGPIDCLHQTWKYEGVRGLYRGLIPPILGAAAENATLFLTYNNIRRGLASFSSMPITESTQAPLSHILIAAGGAGAVTSFVLTPIELIKCKMQVQMLAANPFPAAPGLPPPPPSIDPSTLPGPLAILKSVVRADGLRGLWLGHTGTLIRETGGGVAWFGAKEVVSRFLLARRTAPSSLSPSPLFTPAPVSSATSVPPPPPPAPQLKPWESALSGACAGVFYTVLLFPADCVKSTIQTEQELRPRVVVPGQEPAPKSTFLGVFKQIYRTRGLKGLYAGCGVTVARSAPSSALVFVIYDALEKYFG